MRKAVTTADESKKVVFGDRVCFRPDDDVRKALNECGIDWHSQSHALNALIKRGLQRVVPNLPEHPFDKAALDGIPPRLKKILAEKGGAK